MRPTIRGMDMNFTTLWEVQLLECGTEWIGTGRNHMLTKHFEIKQILSYYLEYYPLTYKVEYVSDKTYEDMVVPSAFAYKQSQIIAEYFNDRI